MQMYIYVYIYVCLSDNKHYPMLFHLLFMHAYV